MRKWVDASFEGWIHPLRHQSPLLEPTSLRAAVEQQGVALVPQVQVRFVVGGQLGEKGHRLPASFAAGDIGPVMPEGITAHFGLLYGFVGAGVSQAMNRGLQA